MAPRPSYRLTRIPEMTIRRLSVYTRCLLQLEEDGVKTVSSQELADRFNLNSAQVRKDLAYFGEFGVRGIGYYVPGLKAELQAILNFAPARLKVPRDVRLKNVDLSIELETLSFYLAKGSRS